MVQIQHVFRRQKRRTRKNRRKRGTRKESPDKRKQKNRMDSCFIPAEKCNQSSVRVLWGFFKYFPMFRYFLDFSCRKIPEFRENTEKHSSLRTKCVCWPSWESALPSSFLSRASSYRQWIGRPQQSIYYAKQYQVRLSVCGSRRMTLSSVECHILTMLQKCKNNRWRFCPCHGSRS